MEDKGGEAENVSLEGVGQAGEDLENSCRCDQWKSGSKKKKIILDERKEL